MDRLLDPKNDWAFKQVFGQEKNKPILIKFLNDMLGDQVLHGDQIADLSFLKVELDTEIITLRQSIVDVLCKTIDERHFIVEMQRASDTGFIQRAVEYASRVYLNQRTIDKKTKNDKGGYKTMRPVIFLAIMEKTLFPQKEAYLSHHQFRDIVTGEQDIKEMSFSFLELSKFHKHFHELETDIDQWAYYFKKAEHISPEKLDKILSQGTVFGEAYKVLEKSAYTKSQLLEYIRYELKEEEIKTRIGDAKAQGRAEGAREKAIETAKNLLKINLSVEQVAEVTGLFIEKVKKFNSIEALYFSNRTQ